jgi:large subunit ribosomal protein L6
MSRIGKLPVTIPQGVTVDLAGGVLTTKGKLGTLKLALNSEVDTVVKDGKVVITPKNETKRARMAWGTTRALVNNMVGGVNTGYTVNLEINGVGYRAAVQGKNLVLQLQPRRPVSHPVRYQNRVREADRDRDQRRRQAARRSGRGGDPLVPRSRAL